MLIDGNYISNDVITLGTCFFNLCFHLQSFPLQLIGGNLTAHLKICDRQTLVKHPTPHPVQTLFYSGQVFSI